MTSNKKIVTLKDNTPLSNQFSSDDAFQEELRNDLKNLKDVLVVKLSDEEDDQKLRDLTYYFGKEEYLGNYIGFFKGEHHTYFIKSRFDKNDKNFFTYHLLKASFGDGFSYLKDNQVAIGFDGMMTELLIVQFISQINQAYAKGVYRQYQTFEANDMKLRGRIDFSRHIKENPLSNGKVAYSYRELTVNNPINQLVISVLHLLEKEHHYLVRNLLDRWSGCKDYVNQMQGEVDILSPQTLKRQQVTYKKKIANSLYRNWDEVRVTALKLLKSIGITIHSKETDSETDGILIRIDELWENYLEKVLKSTEANELSAIETQHDFPFLEGKRTARPDFYLKDKFIMDAKYKSAWSRIAEGQSSWTSPGVREDVFQILSYMYLKNFKKTGVFCPVDSGESEGFQSYLINETKPERKFYIIPFKIPNSCSTAEVFEDEIKKSEKAFRELVKDELVQK